MKLRTVRPWNAAHLATLRRMWVEKAALGPTKRAGVIASVLGRPPATVYATARRLGLVGDLKATLAKFHRQARLRRLYVRSQQG